MICTACGVFYKEPFDGFPMSEQLCAPCWSARDGAKAIGRCAELDRGGRCGFCGSDIVGSVRAHEEICSFTPTLEQIDAAIKRRDGIR
jgi:hypothetical protein